MGTGTAGSSSKKSARHALRVLRPLFWWLLLVLILYGIRTHQRLMDQTRIRFTTSLNSKNAEWECKAYLDGQLISSGTRISLGKHAFSLAHPKAEAFSTNFFTWYKGGDLGEIYLTRARGTLAITADPAPRTITVVGPEFSTNLFSKTNWTTSVPTDTYRIHAQWQNYEDTRDVSIFGNVSTPVRYEPKLGVVGFKTEPPGARVVDKTGKHWGQTPLLLSEVPAGLWVVELRLEGYVPESISMRVLPNQTNSSETILTSWQYAQAMESAKRAGSAGNYDSALEALAEALKRNGEDPEANRLKKQFTVARHMQRGKNFAQREDYGSARTELEALLQIQPEQEDAKALLASVVKRQEDILAENQKREAQAAAERNRRIRLENLDTSLNSLTAQYPDGRLFDAHKLTLTKAIKPVGDAIREALTTKAPNFEVTKYEWPGENTFLLDAKQQVPGGLRQALIVGTEGDQNESVIIFRVLEYESHLNLNLGGVFRVSDGRPPLVALPNQKDRINEGVELVLARIKSAAP